MTWLVLTILALCTATILMARAAVRKYDRGGRVDSVYVPRVRAPHHRGLGRRW